MNQYRVVYVEPGKPAVEKKIGTKLEDLQAEVGGLIECIYCHRDGTLIVANDEAKLLGMEGNRRLDGGSVIAGPFFVIGDAGENFRSLTDAEVNRYLQVYAEPQQISQREVRADIPKLNLQMPIYMGAAKENMAAGAAVMGQTSLPIGGSDTNCVLAGHRGWNGAAYFLYINQLEPGDTVTVTNLWETLNYQVKETRIIDPNDVEAILIQPGHE